MRIAVMAGTPIDTQMGAELLASHGIKVGCLLPISNKPSEQTHFQTLSTEVKQVKIEEIIHRIEQEGYTHLLVYCNSLSAAVDFNVLQQKTSIQIITPMNMYRDIAQQYKELAVFSANAQGSSGIEKVMIQHNPSIQLITVAMIELVERIERQEKPEQIIAETGVVDLLKFIANNQIEAIVLGCTHFPYLKEAIALCTHLPIIDPAEKMIEQLKK